MEEQIITVTQNWANMQDLAEKFATKIRPYDADYFRSQLDPEEQKRIDERKREKEIKRLGGLRAYEDFTRENYKNKAVLKALANFPQENYYLWGPAGAGKTHAAVAVLRDTACGQVVRMARISRWFRGFERTDEESRAIKACADMTLLIDDLGSEKMTEYLQGILFEIMDRRWQYKRGGLLITSNVSIEKLGEVIGDRTASRIAGLVGAKNMIKISGKDWRLK